MSAPQVFAELRARPTLAPLIFVTVYALCGTLMLPTLPLNLGAGIVWGPAWGALFTIAGVTAGAASGFIAARYLVGDWARTTFTHPLWRGLQREVARQDWRAVVFARVNPIFPSALVNYFFGITAIGFGRYLTATVVSVAPMATLFAIIGHESGAFVLTRQPPNLTRAAAVLSAPLTALLLLVMWRRARVGRP